LDIYRELLTYDMYLRENLKSRPDFATDLTEEDRKKEIKEFYKMEESRRKYLGAYGGYDWKQLSKMTHLEPFYYRVWDMQEREVTEVSLEPVYVLFDYQVRNPLTGEARTVFVK